MTKLSTTYTIGVFRISLVEPDLTQSAALRQQYKYANGFSVAGGLGGGKITKNYG